MYYEEKIIDGILSHRNTPNGEWIPFTAEELTVKIKVMTEAIKDIAARIWTL